MAPPGADAPAPVASDAVLIDANLLIWAHHRQFPRHDQAREWLVRVSAHTPIVGIPWPSILAFLRISSHPRALERPITVETAWAVVDGWLERPNVRVPVPTERIATSGAHAPGGPCQCRPQHGRPPRCTRRRVGHGAAQHRPRLRPISGPPLGGSARGTVTRVPYRVGVRFRDRGASPRARRGARRIDQPGFGRRARGRPPVPGAPWGAGSGAVRPGGR